MANDVLVGAPFDDTGGVAAGAVYLFDGKTGRLIGTFRKPHPAPGDLFGAAVAVIGYHVLVGAPGDGLGAPHAGAAYLFNAVHGSPMLGSVLQVLPNPAPATGDQFGAALAILPRPGVDDVLIGAPGSDRGGADAGVAYRFGFCGGHCSTTTTTTTSTSTTMQTTTTTSTVTTTSRAPTTTTTTTSTTTRATTTSTTLAVTCPGGCDDGDHCTVDTCDPTRGCVHADAPVTEPAAAACAIANVRDAVRTSAQCTRRCPSTAERRLKNLENAVRGATQAWTAGKCRRRMRAASSVARSLENQLGRLGASTAPAAAAMRLRERLPRIAQAICEPPR